MGSTEEERLSQMVIDFIESGSAVSVSFNTPQPHHKSAIFSLQEILHAVTDAEAEVLAKILMYMKDVDDMINSNNLKKWMVLKLKMDRYEASLCKTSWETSLGCLSGEYDYIDVMMRDSNGGAPTRLIVDLDFRSQFELARPTTTYKELLESLPSIFVGTGEKLNKIISLLSTAAKQSLKERGLHIPPWRSASYMQSKWLSENCEKVSFSSTREFGVPNYEPKPNKFCGSSKHGMWAPRMVNP